MVPATARTPPSAEDLAIWAQGSRTVTQARAQTGLSRQEPYALMDAGVVHWCTKDLKGTRLLAWRDLNAYVASLPRVAKKPARKTTPRTAAR